MATRRVKLHRRRAIVAIVAAVGTAILVVATASEGTASGSRQLPCVPTGKRLSISRFTPASAKAGSNTEVTVYGTHLNYVVRVKVGPKGRQTFVMFNYSGGAIHFTVPDEAVSGPIYIEDCGADNFAWSKTDLRV
jgi:IPT/TIG domain